MYLSVRRWSQPVTAAKSCQLAGEHRTHQSLFPESFHHLCRGSRPKTQGIMNNLIFGSGMKWVSKDTDSLQLDIQ